MTRIVGANIARSTWRWTKPQVTSAPSSSPGREGDSPDQVPADQKLGTVTGDGGCDTRPCHTPILEHGGVAPKLRKWIEAMGAKTACIEPGSHRENACRESFNARFYNEMLHREVYSSLREAQITHRAVTSHHTHTALGYSPRRRRASWTSTGGQ